MRVDESRLLPLNPGALRHQIEIQQKVVTSQNSRGEDVYTWALVYFCYASITALQGRELETAQQRWADARYRIEAQYLAGVERAMRIRWWDGSAYHLFNILDAVDPQGMRDRLVMICREWVE